MSFERSMIDASDRARELVRGIPGADIASIVVLGDRHSGKSAKSSTLECLTGIKLPSGVDINRVPLQIACRRTPAGASRSRYAEIRCPESASFKDCIEIGLEEVDSVQKAIKEAVSPIYLSVYSPDIPDMTLIDLPELAPVTEGQESSNVDVQIINMVRNYIKTESATIVCVVPINADLSTMECVRLAREVDPFGRRTIEIMSKTESGVMNDLKGHCDSDFKLFCPQDSHTLAEKLARIDFQKIRDSLPQSIQQLHSLLKKKKLQAMLASMAHQLESESVISTSLINELVSIMGKSGNGKSSHLSQGKGAASSKAFPQKKGPESSKAKQWLPRQFKTVTARLVASGIDFAKNQAHAVYKACPENVKAGARGLSKLSSLPSLSQMFKKRGASPSVASTNIWRTPVSWLVNSILQQLINLGFQNFPHFKSHLTPHLNTFISMMSMGANVNVSLSAFFKVFCLLKALDLIPDLVRGHHLPNDPSAINQLCQRMQDGGFLKTKERLEREIKSLKEAIAVLQAVA